MHLSFKTDSGLQLGRPIQHALFLKTFCQPFLFDSPDFHETIKVNLHSIRFSYVFVRFFTLLLLLEKVFAFSSAFYVSIYALSRLLHTDKNFV